MINRELTKEEIDLLIKRVKSRISRLELWLYQNKFKENSKYGAELEHLRKLKSDLVTAKRVRIYCKGNKVEWLDGK